MKRFFRLVSIIALAVTATNNASAGTGADEQAGAGTLYINAPRFARPIVEQWIEEYKAVAPDVTFAIAGSAEEKEASRLSVEPDGDAAGTGIGMRTVFFAGYAVLPVAAKGSEAARLLGKQHLNQKRLKSLFFVNDEYEPAAKKDVNGDLVVYSGSSDLSVSHRFAAHFGKDAASFKGKRIVGDDLFLLAAIGKDSKGVTVNTLPNIYDLQTRHLKDNLSLVALDVDKNTRTVLSDDATLDELITVLEADRDSGIPVGRLGISFNDADSRITQFVAWILAAGCDYNHRYGLLSLDDKTMARQAEALSVNYTAQK